MTALHFASAMRHEDMVKLLLARGAVVNAANDEGFTALMIAARAGLAGAVQCLLEGRADVNAANREGITALMQAARGHYLTVVKLLIDNGADPRLRDHFGRRAVQYAFEKGNPPAVLLRLLKPDDTTGKQKPADASRPWWRFWGT
jgi:ankyrin repeat protein